MERLAPLWDARKGGRERTNPFRGEQSPPPRIEQRNVSIQIRRSFGIEGVLPGSQQTASQYITEHRCEPGSRIFMYIIPLFDEIATGVVPTIYVVDALRLPPSSLFFFFFFFDTRHPVSEKVGRILSRLSCDISRYPRREIPRHPDIKYSLKGGRGSERKVPESIRIT